MDLGNGLGHLTYSTLVHPADDWEHAVDDSLITYLPKVKARIAGNQSFGVSLRLSAKHGADARRQRRRARQAQEVPRRQRHVPLHRQRLRLRRTSRATVVKEQVYEPDWRGEERTQLHHQRRQHPRRCLRRRTSRHRSRPRRSASSRGSPAATWSRAIPTMSCASSRIWSRSNRRPDCTVQLGARARAVLLSRDHRRDRRVFQQAPLFGRGGGKARQACAPADRGGERGAAPASRHRLRHLSSGGRVRGHHPVAAEAGRCRRPDLQAAGSRRSAMCRK